MGEGHIQKFTQAVQQKLLLWLALIIVVALGTQWAVSEFTSLNPTVSTLIALSITLIIGFISSMLVGASIVRPTAYLSQSIQHISPNEHLAAAPNIDDLKLGHELVSTLTRQIYSYATSSQQTQPSTDAVPSSLFDQLPLAVIGLDSDSTVVFTNNRATTLAKTSSLIGQKFKDVLVISSESEESLASWLDTSRENSLTNYKLWEKIELSTINNESLGYFDMAVNFSKDSASGVETVIAWYDHSTVYGDEMNSVSFVSLAVHEMRTPVTIMRGYIEAFEDELGDSITPQLADDLRKMNASAQGLTSFVSNILNVTRINEGRLSLNLTEQSWNTALPQIVDGLRNRAAVYGKAIELRMEPNMPTVALDRMTIGEVVTNLIDNAIKYAPDNSGITIISRVNREGVIETTVEDHGVGIPESVMPHLFSKFYRNHRNQAQIGGTGLGLFLSKAIVTAHRGNIWANSKENEGSTFGFSLIPYEQLASELQSTDNEGIVRSSHGWIKNHSMQRR